MTALPDADRAGSGGSGGSGGAGGPEGSGVVPQRRDPDRAGDVDALLAQALDALAVSVRVADASLPDLPLVYADAAFERTTGYTAEEVVGRNCRFLQGDRRAQPGVGLLRDALASRAQVTVELVNVKKDGTPFTNEITLTPLADATGSVHHILALQRHVTAERATRDRGRSLRREQDELLRALQATLAPARLPRIPGVTLALRYLPGTRTRDGAAISGDFYDAWAIPGDDCAPAWSVVIGDVAGRGAQAAARTSAVRNLLRGVSYSGGDPAGVLRLLNRALLDTPSDRFVTVALAHLLLAPDGERGRVLRLAPGGHPHPLLLREGTAAPLGSPGTLLGALEEVSVADTEHALLPGDHVVLFTDGITEAGPPADQFGSRRPAAAAAGGGPEAVADAVLFALDAHAGLPDDDCALLVVAVER